uniref:NADH:ubiquinone reductase (H(+)-translocating) n=1 Tax=Cephea cephea TaxID=880218 RepID=A0AAU6W6R4_9CNID
MDYNSCEIVLLIILIVSLVVRIPLSFLNKSIILLSFILIIPVNALNLAQVDWETMIKLLCLIFGYIFINYTSNGLFTSSQVLVLCVVLASCVMVSTHNLLALYLCLELQSLSIYVLIARKRGNVIRVEASLKYFVLSSIASGLFLLGSALIFVTTGSCEYLPLCSTTLTPEKSLIVIALLFKLAASPFHFWIPDVYQGADNKALLTLGILPKISVFGLLVILFPHNMLITFAAIMSLLIGSIGAINQSRFNRLLAYSSILGIGFVLLGLASETGMGVESSLIYLIIYLFSFCLVILVSQNLNKGNSLIVEVSNLLGYNKVLLMVFGLTILSIAGIPPLGGFLAKWFIISSAVSQGFILLPIVAILCAVIAGAYYLRLVKIAYFQYDKTFLMWQKVLLRKTNRLSKTDTIMGIISYVIIFLLISPKIILQFTHYGAISMF